MKKRKTIGIATAAARAGNHCLVRISLDNAYTLLQPAS